MASTTSARQRRLKLPDFEELDALGSVISDVAGDVSSLRTLISQYYELQDLGDGSGGMTRPDEHGDLPTRRADYEVPTLELIGALYVAVDEVGQYVDEIERDLHEIRKKLLWLDVVRKVDELGRSES